MIRFIDLRGQITNDNDPHFAFFDTIKDRFLDFLGETDWISIEGLRSCCTPSNAVLIGRCVDLIPPDYFEKHIASRIIAPAGRSYFRSAIFDVLEAGRFEHDHRWYLYAVDPNVRDDERVHFVSAVMKRFEEIATQFEVTP